MNRAEKRRRAVLEALRRANQGSTPTPARPGTPALGGQDERTDLPETDGRCKQEIGPCRGSQRTEGKDEYGPARIRPRHETTLRETKP